jgi:hypothetical protein
VAGLAFAQPAPQTGAPHRHGLRGLQMPINKSLRIASTFFGIVAALIELYLGLVVAFNGVTGPFKILLVLTMPILVVWGAIGVMRFREADIGAGIMLLGFSLQHCLIEIRLLAQVPLGLILVAAALAFAAATIERQYQPADTVKA